MKKAWLQWGFGMILLVSATTAAADGGETAELELSWNAAIGTATYEENDTLHGLSSMGLLLEINPGMLVTTAPGLDVGVAVGFLILSSGGEFSVDYEGPPASTRNWEVSAISVGSYVLAQYEYVMDLEVLKLGLSNGIGAGYFINNVDAEWEDASDSNITGSPSSNEQGLTPMVRAGLDAELPVTESSTLGLNLGVDIMPLEAGEYLNFITLEVGLGYAVRY